MIAAFLEDWELFADSCIAGWGIAVTLALFGVVVVVRDQVFLGAAVSQASTLGIALALWAGAALGHSFEWLEAPSVTAAAAILFSILAALITARGGRRESHEAVTGWVFLVSASCSILLVASSPHGIEEVHKLLFSSIIGATRADAWIAVAMALLAGVAALALHRRLLLVTVDPPMAAALGLRTRLWQIGIAVGLGLVIGLSIRVSGLLYTFGCLVLPALAAKSLVREVTPMFVLAPVLALAAAVAGFVLAHARDLPQAQMTVALLSALVVVAWGVRAVRERSRGS